MKKLFPLHVPGKEHLRVLEAIKVELTKYVKRERRKPLPIGMTCWDFECRVGSESHNASNVALLAIPQALNALALAGSNQVYVEIMAAASYREKRISTDLYPGKIQ